MVQGEKPASIHTDHLANDRRRERVIFKSLIIDATLWIPDIIIAFLTGSGTLFADAIKSGNEILSTFFTWLAMKKIAGGQSHVYDYGMGKFENLTGMITGLIMFLSLILVFSFTSLKLLNPSMLHEKITEAAIFMMGLGVCVNTWLYYEKKHISEEEYSPAMESQMHLFKTKAYTDFAVLVALICVEVLHEYWWAVYIDPLASFIVIAFFLYTGYRVLRSSIPDLLDKTLDEELQLVIIRALTAFFEDYTALHAVRSRRSGKHIYIEIFLEFDGEKKMSEVQDAINRMKKALESDIPKSSVTIIPSGS
jgi:cation diffusion facilitator family transporter